MAPDLLLGLVKVNLAAGAATLVVAVLRKPVRIVFGARLAYGLWGLVPLAMAASLAPPRPAELIPLPAVTPAANVVAAVEAQASDWFVMPADGISAVAQHAWSLDPVPLASALWAVGALAMIAWLVLRQSQFMADLARGDAGPAVIGFLKPRIVTPSDFTERFTAREQTVVLAHERVHLARHDARLNALVAFARCVCWFNPLVHLAAHLMRIDQELACDAAVVERHPKARKPYAQALLKAQLAARPLPLGCYWPAGTEHPLTERIAMLKFNRPSRLNRLAGGSMLILLCGGVGLAAWASQPAGTKLPTSSPAGAHSISLAPVAPFVPAPTPTAEKPVQLALAEPAPTPRPEPQASGTGNPISGPMAGILVLNPVSDIQISNGAGGYITVHTVDSNTLMSDGVDHDTMMAAIKTGAQINVTAYNAPDGSGLYADPADFSMNGAQLFPKAVAEPGVVQKLMTRMSICGVRPPVPTYDPLVDKATNDARAKDVEAALIPYMADCKAKLAKVDATKADGPGIPSIISNSVKRTGG